MFCVKEEQKTSSEKVAMYNLKKLSPHHDLTMIFCAMKGWMSENPEASLQDLEKALRQEDLDIYLIANNKHTSNSHQLVNFTKPWLPAKYMLVASCRPKDDAMRELLTYHRSYEDNFNLLNDCGGMVSIKETITEEEFNKQIEEKRNKSLDQIDIYDKLTHNRIKVGSVSNRTPKEVLEDDIKKVEKTGMKVEQKMVGMGPGGGPILGYFTEAGLISGIGVHIYHNESGEQMARFIKIT